MKLGEVVLQFQQVSSNSDKKQKSFIKIAHLTDVLSVKVPLRSCYGVAEFSQRQK